MMAPVNLGVLSCTALQTGSVAEALHDGALVVHATAPTGGHEPVVVVMGWWWCACVCVCAGVFVMSCEERFIMKRWNSSRR